MPWEIDYALTTFSQLNKSKYYLPSNLEIKIRTTLNLSHYIIDWDKSQLPKDFFIDKYHTLSMILNKYDHKSTIYDGPDLYGHLDAQKQAYKEDSDYYIGICPDIYFSKHLLSYIIQAAQQIKNESFYLTPQICTLWDKSWDIITNNNIGVLGHEQWIDRDIFDIDYYLHNNVNEPIQLQPINTHKWAGWFDLYNRKFVEKLGNIPNEWSGYGAWDVYTMSVSNIAKHIGYDFQQYLLTGLIIFPYSHGVKPFIPPHDGLTKYYKDRLSRKETNQREIFNANVDVYIQKKLEELLK